MGPAGKIPMQLLCIVSKHDGVSVWGKGCSASDATLAC